jgi:molecular chaperone DnaK (HSP70)
VGGSSRTPLVQQRLRELTGRAPRAEVNPDLCVALGAGVMASRLAGHDVDRVLVDISPYAFGISHLGERDGQPYPYCFRPTIPRNSALPVTRTESYFTVLPYQEAVRFEIFQGDDPDALRNVPVGAFTITDLATQEEQNEVLCRMRLDLDGILTVTALEKRTGLSKAVTIEQALRPRSEAEIDAARAKLDRLFAPIELDDELDDDDGEDDDAPEAAVEDPAPPPPEPVADEASTTREARALLERSRGLLDQMHPDDQEEAIGLHQAIEQALAAGDAAALDAAVKTLNELVFFVAGR